MQNLERVEPDEANGLLGEFMADTRGIQLHCQWYFDRQGPLRDIIHALKYENRPWYGLFLGRVLAASISSDSTADMVIPLPLHRLRLLERGYNQAEWIAGELAAVLDRPLVLDVLTRPRPTGTQTALKRDDRWQNVRDAFAASATASAGYRHALLIDDVVTTGATALSAAIALRGAGIDNVTVASPGLARA